MGNTSATGGYLTPNPTPNVLQDASLRTLLHGVVAGITGLGATMVRQAWNPTPAPVPAIEIDWAAFAVVSQLADFDAYEQEATDGSSSTQRRHESLDVLCTFYGPNCQKYAGLLIDGMRISQNRAALYAVGMGSFGFSAVTHSPELFNDRFVDRCDVTMSLRREVVRDYPILSFLAAEGMIETETVSQPWVVDPQGVVP